MEPIAISALEHYIYCPRQCGLIHADGVWADNTHTVHGVRGHRRADTPFGRQERGRLVLHAVPLWSEQWSLTGRADAVEMLPSGEVVPVEYKIGRRHADAAEIQLCAQALCLEEMLATHVSHGALWYSGSRRRIQVECDAGLRARTTQAIDAIASVLESGHLPDVLHDSRCQECQLLGYCLPEVVAHKHRVAVYVKREVFACG